MPSEKLVAKKENGVGWIVLNNPERHNAISLEMWTARYGGDGRLSLRQVRARRGRHRRRRLGLRFGRRYFQVQG